MVLHKGPCILTLTIDQVLLILTLNDKSGQVDSAGVHVNEGGHIGFCPEEAACTNTTTPTPTLSTASVTQPEDSSEDKQNTISGIVYSQYYILKLREGSCKDKYVVCHVPSSLSKVPKMSFNEKSFLPQPIAYNKSENLFYLFRLKFQSAISLADQSSLEQNAK